MGISPVCLIDENSNVIAKFTDPENSLYESLLPPLEDRSYRCLCYIDPWGDTVFNPYQMDDLIAELDRILASRMHEKQRRALLEIRALAVRCKNEVHTYLKFIGD